MVHVIIHHPVAIVVVVELVLAHDAGEFKIKFMLLLKLVVRNRYDFGFEVGVESLEALQAFQLFLNYRVVMRR